MHSDHCPLLIRYFGWPKNKGNRPFRFQAAWTTHPDYKNIVLHAWNKSDSGIQKKLEEVQLESLAFNRKVFGNVFIRKRELESQLDSIQRFLINNDDPELLKREELLRKDYNSVILQEELMWFQKSREQWVRFGDRNTKFFHAQMIIRRKSNKVHGLFLSDGTWSIDSDSIQHEASSYFKNLFCS
ncbi:MAG: hypothetical protein Q8875_02920, partial [Pigeon pea little leaf phytoplasma]|nr:hypothetical protein [Pigeon pea little leaf phytoplasma]